MSKIITEYNPKPIPDRNYDWEAFRNDWDLGDPIGYGLTKEQAIKQLKENEQCEKTDRH